MRKIFLFMMVSADGYFEGPDHDLSWHHVDAEFSDFAVKQLDEASTLVFGRRTYELMAGFWPTKQARQAEPATAERMNALEKVVFSRTLTQAKWRNTHLFKSNVRAAFQALQQQPGKAIAVLGSSNLCVSLLRENLLDEVRLMVNPVVLGRGTSLFAGLQPACQLSLTANKVFRSGNVLLTYKVTETA